MNFCPYTWAFLLLGNAFFFGMPLSLPWGRVKEDVIIGGAEVSLLPYARAEELVRERSSPPPLVIVANGERTDFSSHLTYSDNISDLVRTAKKGDRLEVTYSRQWAEMELDLFRFCLKYSLSAQNAQMSFSSKGFEYIPEKKGLACDYAGLIGEVTAALKEGGEEVELKIYGYSPAVTQKSLKQKTQKLSEFSTAFDGGNLPRAHNIALAAERISGTKILGGEEFSFNRTVGERTEENGFEISNVIEGGEFVPGVGGGVCQVSTTLFGAALRAGMKVTRSQAHSLSVGYVPPSLDAMVSAQSDLTFVNPFRDPVYVLAKVGEGKVSFALYGVPDGKRYETESVVLARLSPPPPEIVENAEGVLRKEKEGIKSESYLLVYGEDGKLISRTRIRRDTYAAVRGKIGSSQGQTGAEMPESPQN